MIADSIEFVQSGDTEEDADRLRILLETSDGPSSSPLTVPGGGRIIYAQQRETDETTPIIGTNIEENHAAAVVQTTKSKGMNDKTRKEYRNLIMDVISNWAAKRQEYFSQWTYLLTEEQKADATKYYFKNDRDLIYRGLNANMVIAFCSGKKIKASGNLISPIHLSKYGDAIKWGATTAGEVLPPEFHVEFENFISSYKKEYNAKKEGKVDKKAVDSINAGLSTLILTHGIRKGIAHGIRKGSGTHASSATMVQPPQFTSVAARDLSRVQT